MSGETTLSPSHFREPLLKALGALTSADATVPQDTAVTRVLSDLNIERDAHGFQEGKGTRRPWTVFWIQRAYLGLKKSGLGLKGKRGQWGLTDEGRALLHKAQGDDAGDYPPGEGISFFVTFEGGIAEDRINDPYILDLLYDQHEADSCYGSDWSAKAPLCAACPVQLRCSNLTVGLLEHYADELDNIDQAPTPDDLSDLGSGDDFTGLQRAIQAAIREGKPPPPLPVGWRWVRCIPGTCCSKCNGEITAIEFTAGKMAPFSTGVGMAHPGCLETTT